MTMIIRSAGTHDIDQMYEISRQTHRDSYGDLIPDARRADFDEYYKDSDDKKQLYRQSIRQRLQDSRWVYFVAEVDDKIAGFTGAWVNDDAVIVKQGLFVLKDNQGQGIGSALFKRHLDSVDTGSVVRLYVLNNNLGAIRLYKKYGFIENGMSDKKFFGVTQLRMERRIGY